MGEEFNEKLEKSGIKEIIEMVKKTEREEKKESKEEEEGKEEIGFRVEMETKKHKKQKMPIIYSLSSLLKQKMKWKIDLDDPSIVFHVFLLKNKLFFCVLFPRIKLENHFLCFDTEKSFRKFQSDISLRMRKEKHLIEENLQKKKQERNLLELNNNDNPLEIPLNPPESNFFYFLFYIFTFFYFILF